MYYYIAQVSTEFGGNTFIRRFLVYFFSESILPNYRYTLMTRVAQFVGRIKLQVGCGTVYLHVPANVC